MNPGSFLLKINETTIGGKVVLDPEGSDPSVNWFYSSTGAGRYGYGVFLISVEDYGALRAVGETPVPLILKDHRGQQISMSVIVLGCTSYSGKVSESSTVSGVVLVTVADLRIRKTEVIDDRFNLQNLDASGDEASFFEDTINGENPWTWEEMLAAMDLPELEEPPSWNPRNVSIAGWQEHRVVDWISANLFLVVGWDWSTGQFSFNVPGVPTAANLTKYNLAKSQLYLAGGSIAKNTRRLPSGYTVSFQGYEPGESDTVGRSYQIGIVGTGQGASQPISIGSYTPIWMDSEWKEQDTLDEIAEDIVARFEEFIRVETATYVFSGIVPIHPDGKIREIVWKSNKGGATTTVAEGTMFDWEPQSGGGMHSYAAPRLSVPMQRLELETNQSLISIGRSVISQDYTGTKYLSTAQSTGISVKVLEPLSHGETYGGRLQGPPTSEVAYETASALTAAEVGEAVIDCIVVNSAGVGQTDHSIPANKILIGTKIGVASTGGRSGQAIISVSYESSSVKYGKIVSYTPGANVVELDPCTSGGTDNGEANLDAYIELPTSKTVCSFFAGAVNDVLAYVQQGGETFLLNYPRPYSETQYDVFQTTAANGQGGFDSVRVKA